jgi:hypothetical protein
LQSIKKKEKESILNQVKNRRDVFLNCLEIALQNTETKSNHYLRMGLLGFSYLEVEDF